MQDFRRVADRRRRGLHGAARDAHGVHHRKAGDAGRLLADAGLVADKAGRPETGRVTHRAQAAMRACHHDGAGGGLVKRAHRIDKDERPDQGWRASVGGGRVAR